MRIFTHFYVFLDNLVSQHLIYLLHFTDDLYMYIFDELRRDGYVLNIFRPIFINSYVIII